MSDGRPPYIDFYTEAVALPTDPNDPLALPKYKDVIYVKVMQIGSRDSFSGDAEEWLAQQAAEVRNERLPRDWYKMYMEKFEAYKSGQDSPVNGTAISNWPAATKAQVATLHGLGVKTIEDLAELPDEALQRVGLGSLQLRQKAKDFIAAASDQGKVAQEMETLRLRVQELEMKNSALQKVADEVSQDRANQTPGIKLG